MEAIANHEDLADAYLAEAPDPNLTTANLALRRVEQACSILAESRPDDRAALLVRVMESRELARLTAQAVREEREEVAAVLAGVAEDKVSEIRSLDPARFVGILDPGDERGDMNEQVASLDRSNHGTLSSYSKRKCRCGECKGAYREYMRARRAKG
jgi:hypothetical protein